MMELQVWKKHFLFTFFIYVIFLPAFLDTGLPRGNGHERDSQVPCKVLFLPNPTIRKSWPHHRGLSPLFFSNSGVGSLHSTRTDKCKCCETGPRDFRPYPRVLQKVQPFADVITKAVLSSQLFKDPECWFSRGFGRRPPAQQTGTLQTELTRGRLYCN